MKRDYRDENFEEFLKRNADNLRMKAPEKVWQNLSSRLEKSRRRFGIGLSAFFLVASVLGYLTISTTNYSFRPATDQSVSSKQNTTATADNTGSQKTILQENKKKPDFVKPAVEPQERLTANTNSPQATEPTPINQLSEQANANVQNEFMPTIVDDYTPVQKELPQAANLSGVNLAMPANTTMPWTIESTINHYLHSGKRKEKRFQTQFHFTPTISYRKLSENKSYLRHTSLSLNNYNVLYSSVNSMVTHKPDIGFELGVTEKYSLSKKVRLRAGLQLNMNRYDIKAFQAPYALTTITLNNRGTATVDSLWTLANYSNVNMGHNDRGSWLQNYSFQVSAPIGVELALKGNEKMQFGIATSVQPTYVLGDRAYLITSDYKSYTQVPWLLRRWNVNTALETFVQYQTGRTRWQVGPQVRYQLLSSFITNYPVKENLFDFGLKIGVSVVK